MSPTKPSSRWPQVEDTEGVFQAWVVATARANGYRVHVTLKRLRRASIVADPDWPDLEIVGKGRLIFVEVKSAHGRLSDGQRGVIAMLQEAGQEVYVWDPRDAESVLVTLK